MELRIDATSPAPDVPRADQPLSSLSQPVLTTPSQRLNSIHEVARCPPSRIADITVNKTSCCSFSTGAITGTFCFHCEKNSWFCCGWSSFSSHRIFCLLVVRFQVDNLCRWKDMEGSTGKQIFPPSCQICLYNTSCLHQMGEERTFRNGETRNFTQVLTMLKTDSLNHRQSVSFESIFLLLKYILTWSANNF